MPAKSKAQMRFMQAVSHNKKFADKVGVSQKVGKEFDHMAKGGNYEGSAADMAEDKKQAKKRGMSLSKWENSAADKKMDAAHMKKGGMKKMAKGGTYRSAADGVTQKGRTKGTQIKMK